MKVDITKTTVGMLLSVEMKEGESICAEPGSIISATGEIEIKSELAGGIATSVMRTFGGESAFINRIVAKRDLTLQLGTLLPSEIAEVDLDGAMILGDGVYIAHTGDIKITSKFGGLTSLSVGAGFMLMRAEGKGKLYLAGGESIFKKKLKEGEVLFLDNMCFVGTEADVKIEKFVAGKGIISKFISGEGIMLKITGPATVYYQTENPVSLAHFISKYIKT